MRVSWRLKWKVIIIIHLPGNILFGGFGGSSGFESEVPDVEWVFLAGLIGFFFQ
jgi:hypothetical protein